MDKYWYCVKHHAVEEADGCPPIDRLGPYPSYAAAEQALETVKRRNDEWDAQDEARKRK